MFVEPKLASMEKYSLLFRPFPFGEKLLLNRIVMAPMTRMKSPRNIPDQHVVAYYSRRAEGGVGLIITEGTCINHKAAHGFENSPSFYGEALLGWRQVVKAVHKQGGAIIPQLLHVGSTRTPRHRIPHFRTPSYGPSAIVHPHAVDQNNPPQELSLKEIDKIIAAYMQAALDAKRIGFDGVELHGAHGYLIDQFLWSYTNRRTDQYGGNHPRERTKFAVDVIKAIRAQVGPDFPIVFRFSQWKQGNYHAKIAETPQELDAILQPLADASVDMFHASTRRYFEPEFPGSSLNLAGWAKKITSKPTITVGSVGLSDTFHNSLQGKATETVDINNLLERFAKSEFDLVAVGRALIANPDWPNKIMKGKFEDIRPFSKTMLETLF